MGWGSILGAIGGIAAAPFTGGASLIPSLISAGAQVGEAALSAHAEKKAAQQQQAGAQRANANLSPYNQLGVQSANTLAGLLGLPGLPGGAGGGGGPMPMAPTPIAQPMPTTMQGTMTPVVGPMKRGGTLASIRRGPPPPSVSSYGMNSNAAGSRLS